MFFVLTMLLLIALVIGGVGLLIGYILVRAGVLDPLSNLESQPLQPEPQDRIAIRKPR